MQYLRKSIVFVICCVFWPMHLWAFESQSFTLSNGMQVVLIPNTKIEAVTHMVWYRVGAADEPLGKSGIAHLLEHLMFKGTPSFPEGSFSKNVAKIGGVDNAFTGADYTAYYQTVPKDALPLVMEMEADRMQHITFSEEDFQQERDVVIEERLTRVDSRPKSVLSEQMKNTLFQHHPYGRPIIGWMHEINTLTRQDAMDFYAQHYHPANAILVVAGDIDKAYLQSLANTYYGSITPQKSLDRTLIALKEPPHTVNKTLSLSDNSVHQPVWLHYYLAPSQHTEGREHAYALTVLSHMLTEGDNSLLYKELVLDTKLATQVGGYYDDMKLGPSIFTIQVYPKAGQMDNITALVRKRLAYIQAHGVPSDALERAKNLLIAHSIFSQESLKDLAFIYGHAVTNNLGTDYIEGWTDKIAKIDNEAIKAAAAYVFSNSPVEGELLGP